MTTAKKIDWERVVANSWEKLMATILKDFTSSKEVCVPRNNSSACSVCGKPSTATPANFVIGHVTADGFGIWNPDCKHGKFLVCPDCEKNGLENIGCPQCGCTIFKC